ncbi:MAG: serine/threonine protein kinase, partial [Planctomycetes bacterium]|nr:serine/threonine protein kinase [Planctomycetota bacterium]
APRSDNLGRRPEHVRVESLYLRMRELPPRLRERLLATEPDPKIRDEVVALLRQAPIDPLRQTEPEAFRWNAPERLGVYRIRGRVGEGAMGSVYEAVDPAGRRVALKVLKTTGSLETEARFAQERALLERMSHPNIARVIGGGFEGEHAYFAMEYIDGGQSIVRYCREREEPLRGRLERFLELCDGVAHAHDRGIIHRDLKPANILVSIEAGIARTKVIDFGIAKVLGEDPNDPGWTGQVHVLGTENYMSPEHRADAREVTVQSDVYSLGVILGELVVGTLTPPDDESRFSRVREPYHRFDARRVPRDLQAILRRAVEPEVGLRYRNVPELRDDVRAFLNGEPVRARLPGPFRSFWIIVTRHPALCTAVLCAGVSLGLLVLREVSEADRARDQSRRLAAFVASTFDNICQLDESAADLDDRRRFWSDFLSFVEVHREGDRDLRYWHAEALRHLGDVEHEANQLEKAQEFHFRSVELLSEIEARSGEDIRFEAARSVGLVNLGDLAKERGEDDVAEDKYREALELDEWLSRLDPIYRDNLYWSYERLTYWYRTRNPDESVRFRHAAWRLVQDELQNDPNALGFRHARASLWLIEWEFARGGEDLARQLNLARNALDDAEFLVARRPVYRTFRHLEARAWHALALTQRSRGLLADAQEASRHAVRCAEFLASGDPRQLVYSLTWLSTLWSRWELLRDLHLDPESREHAKRMIDAVDRVASIHPDHPRVRGFSDRVDRAAREVGLDR